MRLLFEMDKRDYDNCTHRFVRNSARSIIIRENKIAMIHSLKHDYYKFPGGGIEGEESPISAMIRETREEAGLVIKPDTVKEYGYVHRIQKSDRDATEYFVQDNYYYLCDARLLCVACVDGNTARGEERNILCFASGIGKQMDQRHICDRRLRAGQASGL